LKFTALLVTLATVAGLLVSSRGAGGVQTAVQPPSSAGALTIAQVQYSGGGDWYANQSGLPNRLEVLRARTGVPVASRPINVRLTDADLWNHPYLYMTGHGNIRLTDSEVSNLRSYLEAGGFLHADDNYGMDESFRREMRRVFPDRELVELPADHPVFGSFYRMTGLPKIHLHDGNPAQAFGIFDQGRLVVFYSYESDLGNGWEDADRHGDPPELREQAFRMGVNLYVYALSQVAR
jgi:hypothetical protein